MSWFRRHIPNRFVRLALVAGLAVIVVAAAGVLLAAAFDRGSAASAPPASAAPASDADKQAAKIRAKAEHKNASTRRIRVGQTLSMTTLKPVRPKRKTAKRRLQFSASAKPSGPARMLQSNAGSTSWTLVASPENAKVIHRPGALTFTPDVHGTYVFERSVADAKGGTHRQRLELQVDPVERLVCVNTRARPADKPDSPLGMKVGDVLFLPPNADPSLQVVVLDRATAGKPSDGTASYSTFGLDDAGYNAYKTFLNGLSDPNKDGKYLVLVNGPLSPADKDKVWGPLEALGAADLPPVDPNQESAFSFIGIPGINKGSAWQTVALPNNPAPVSTTSCDADMAAQQASNLSGWLTHDKTGSNYTYVSPDFVDFDTEAKAPSGQHAISVGNKTYSVPTGQWNGFHAVVLDRRTICDETATTSKCDPGEPLLNQGFGPENGGLDAMNAKLAPWAENPGALLFLAPFAGTDGRKADAVPSIDLITTLRRFGASPLAPGRSLGAGVKYALVGGGQNTGYAAGSAKPIVSESSTDFAHGTGHIAGTLVRDRQNRFGPRDASLLGDELDTLGEIVYAPTSNWPEEGDAKAEAAYKYLNKMLGYTVSDSSNGIRDKYTDWDTAAVVPKPDIVKESWCTKDLPATVDFDAKACETVREELYNELLEVLYVNNFLEQLYKAYMENDTSSDAIITEVKAELEKKLTPPPTKTSLAMTFVHFVLSLASAIPEIGEVFEVAGAELDLAESLATDSGSSADPVQAVYDTADELLVDAEKAFNDAIAHIDAYQPLIVTDYAKLTLVGHRASTSTTPFADGSDLQNPPWVITADKLGGLRSNLEISLKQWLYPPLIDAGFPVWQLMIPGKDLFNTGRTPINFRCEPSHTTYHPFHAEPADGWIKLDNGHDDYYLALSGTRFTPEELEEEGHHATVPDADLLAEVFGAAPDHVGLDRTWYFEHLFKRMLDSGGPLVLDCD